MKCSFFNFRLQNYTFFPNSRQKIIFFAQNRHLYFNYRIFIFIFVIFAIKLQLRSNIFRLLFSDRLILSHISANIVTFLF